MNIFCLDRDPKLAAQYHVDKHVVKMILELSQILSTAHRVLDGEMNIGLTKTGRKQKQYKLQDSRELILYKATHVNHPSCVYARTNSFCYSWTHALLVELCEEYSYRYGKIHKCQSIGLVSALYHTPTNITLSNEELLPFVAMPEHCVKADVVSSYRNYYITEKRRMASWSGKINSREIPWWFNENNV